MGQRKIRVGELVLHELSVLLHSRWRSESVAITLTEADISPDLKNARVYYSVLGDRENVAKAGRLLASIKKELRQMLGKKVILKYTAERAMRLLATMDELEAEERQADCDGAQHAEDEDSDGKTD